MYTYLPYAAFTAAALSFPVFAAPTVITFDDLGLSNLADVTTQYQAQGVVFSGVTDSGDPVNIEVADNSIYVDNNPPSPPFALSNFYGNSPFNRANIMRADFAVPVGGIEFDYDAAGELGSSTAFNIFAYDNLGNLLGTFTEPTATDGNFHHAVIPGTGIGRLDIVNPRPGWGHYIDNLQFDPNATATPDGGSTLGLLGVSAAVAAGVRRKRA